MEEDMAAMFVPTDDAINAYFEKAEFLQDRYVHGRISRII